MQYIKNSLRLHSPEMQRIQACARENGVAVSLGFSENCNGSLYIAQALIGPDGEIKVHRRKMKGTHMERTVFGDGSSHALQNVEELPFARVGSLNCWEHLQPLLKYNAITQNGDIHVAAWPPLGNDVEGDFGAYSMSAEGAYQLFVFIKIGVLGFADRLPLKGPKPFRVHMQWSLGRLCCTVLR